MGNQFVACVWFLVVICATLTGPVQLAAQPTEPTLAQQGMVRYHSRVMQDFIDDVNNYCNDEVRNVHDMFRYAYEPNRTDPGKSIGLSMMSLFFRALSVAELPGAMIIGNALAGINTQVEYRPPAYLDIPFSDISERLKKTSLVLKDSLGAIYDDPVRYWNDTLRLPYEFTRPDGSKTSFVLIKELGQDTLISKYTKSYNVFVEKSRTAYQQMVARRELQTRFRIVVSRSDQDPWRMGSNKYIDPNDWHRDYNNYRVQIDFTGQDMWPMLGYCRRENGVDPKGGSGADWERFRRIAADFMSKNIGSYVLANRQIKYVQFYLVLDDVSMYSRTCKECPLAAEKNHSSASALDNFLFHDNGDGFPRNNGGLAHHYEVFSQWDIPGGGGTWLPEVFTTGVYEESDDTNDAGPVRIMAAASGAEQFAEITGLTGQLSVSVIDASGRAIAKPFEGLNSQDQLLVPLSIQDNAAGVYFLVATSPAGTFTKSFVMF